MTFKNKCRPVYSFAAPTLIYLYLAMSPLQVLPRSCIASSSRLATARLTFRRLSVLPNRQPEIIPFFTPPFGPPFAIQPRAPEARLNKGKGKETEAPRGKGEEEVDDREWEIRVGELGSLYAQLPPNG